MEIVCGGTPSTVKQDIQATRTSFDLSIHEQFGQGEGRHPDLTAGNP